MLHPRVACVVCCCSLFAVGSALQAQEGGAQVAPAGDDDAAPIEHHVGVGVSAGTLYGFGGLMQLRKGNLGLTGSFGYLPILLAMTRTSAAGDELQGPEFTLRSSYHAGANLILYVPSLGSAKYIPGFALGGTYNSFLAFGGTGTAVLDIVLSRHTGVHFGAGLGIYPEGAERAKKALREDMSLWQEGDTLQNEGEIDLNSTVQYHVGAALVLYLM